MVFQCRFRNVRWVNCRFDSNTVFTRCNFIGGSSDYCQGFGTAKWQDIIADEDAKTHISGLLIASGQRSYTEEDLKGDFRSVVEKLVGKGGAGFKTVKDDDLRSGKISVSIHRDLVIEEVQKNLLQTATFLDKAAVGTSRIRLRNRSVFS